MKSLRLAWVLAFAVLVSCGRAAPALPPPAGGPAPASSEGSSAPWTPRPALSASPDTAPESVPAVGPYAASGPGGGVAEQLRRLLPPGATLEPFPGVGGALYATEALTSPGASDVLALYAAGTPHVGFGAHCALAGRGPGQAHRGCHLLVATPTAAQGLRVLWWSRAAGLWTPAPQLVHLLPGAPAQLFVDLPEGASAGDLLSVLSFAGGHVRMLLVGGGADPQVLPPETAGTLPGLAFHHHDTGGSGTWVVWRWDAGLGRFVRADGAFPGFYRRQAARAALAPAGAAWVDYYAALAHLQAGENDRALAMAERGISGVGYMHGSPAFLEIEATVYRRQGDCARAIPLYRSVVASPQPGGGLDWPALPRAYYGLALCARGAGNTAGMRKYLAQAIAAGHGAPHGSATPGDDWYGFARAKRLLAR